MVQVEAMQPNLQVSRQTGRSSLYLLYLGYARLKAPTQDCEISQGDRTKRGLTPVGVQDTLCIITYV